MWNVTRLAVGLEDPRAEDEMFLRQGMTWMTVDSR